MKLLKTDTHLDLIGTSNLKTYERIASRGIIVNNNKILLIYTKRYNDYSFPGGGVDKGENIKDGLIREIKEETGAINIKIVEEFGVYEEYRPCYYKGYDQIHMLSYFYICSADYKLGVATPESYEITNGSIPIWVDISEAIKHNNNILISNAKSNGLSIKRETYMLELVKRTCEMLRV